MSTNKKKNIRKCYPFENCIREGKFDFVPIFVICNTSLETSETIVTVSENNIGALRMFNNPVAINPLYKP